MGKVLPSLESCTLRIKDNPEFFFNPAGWFLVEFSWSLLAKDLLTAQTHRSRLRRFALRRPQGVSDGGPNFIKSMSPEVRGQLK